MPQKPEFDIQLCFHHIDVYKRQLLYGGRVLREGRPQVCRCVRFSDAPPAQQSQTKVSATVRFPDGWHQAQRGEPISFPYRWGANLSPHPPLSFYGRTRKTDRRPLSTKKFRNGCLPPVSNSQALVNLILSGDSGGPKNAGGGEKHYGLRTSRNHVG